MSELASPLFAFDDALRPGYPVLCGVDEAGRGPLAGPCCCAAVVLPAGTEIPGVNDSKKLSEKRREALFDIICAQATAFHVEMVSPALIDEMNILRATLMGMAKAVEGLGLSPDLVLVDGNRLPALAVPGRCVVGGDGKSACIAAASILAKVSRDRYMLALDKEFPQYAFAAHKGYGTKLHYERIALYGTDQPFYRKTFLKKLH